VGVGVRRENQPASARNANAQSARKTKKAGFMSGSYQLSALLMQIPDRPAAIDYPLAFPPGRERPYEIRFRGFIEERDELDGVTIRVPKVKLR
jgi:hypothetical protein